MLLVNPMRNGFLGIGIEGGRKIQQLTAAEGAETGIQVVKEGVHELQGNDLLAEDVSYRSIGPDLGAQPIPAEPDIRESQKISRSLEEAIPFQALDRESLLAEPLLVRGLFPLTLRMPKPARDGGLRHHQAGIGRKYQIRQAFDRFHPGQFGLEILGQHVHEADPLRPGLIGIGVVGDTHPGIDFIFDAVIRRRAD